MISKEIWIRIIVSSVLTNYFKYKYSYDQRLFNSNNSLKNNFPSITFSLKECFVLSINFRTKNAHKILINII